MHTLDIFPAYQLVRQVGKVTGYKAANFPYLPFGFYRGKRYKPYIVML